MEYDSVYIVQQKTITNWRNVGYFLSKSKAEKYKNEFNTKVVVYPTRVVREKLLDKEI